MTARQRMAVIFAALVTALLTVTLVFSPAGADTTAPPTLDDAQAALNHIDQDQAIIQRYFDSQNDKLKPTGVTVTAGDTTLTLNWTAPIQGTPTGYVYGRDGVDSTGFGAYSNTLPAGSTTAVLDKLINGTAYSVYVEAVYPNGNKRVTLSGTPVAASPSPSPSVTSSASPTASPSPSASASPSASPSASVSPSASATPSASPTTSAPPAGRLSGMSYSSGVWGVGDRAKTAAYVAGPRNGVPLDNILVYTWRDSMAAQNAPQYWKDSLPADFNGVTQDLVLAVTTWTSDGAFMTGAQASTLAGSICSVDGTHPIVRLDWEMNLPDGAGSNGAALTSANYSAWVSRFNTVASAMKAAACGIKIDFNPNVGTDQTSGCNSGSYAVPNNCSRQAFQAVKANVDIFGLDTYDSYPPVTSSGSGWSARSNGASFGSLENSRLYAVANGKKFSVPEWGTACNTSGCQWQGNAGGDDPEYVKRMDAFFRTNAGDMAYETYFDDDHSYILSDLIANNPNSRAQMRLDVAAARS